MAGVYLAQGWICISNGVDKEPCAIKTSKVEGRLFVTIERKNCEWCRLLTSKAPFKRPFAATNLFKKWKAALTIALGKECRNEYDDGCENLEAGDADQEARGQTRRKRKRTEREITVVYIDMPSKANGPTDFRLLVFNSKTQFSFEYTMENVQWARDYIMSGSGAATAPAAPEHLEYVA